MWFNTYSISPQKKSNYLAVCRQKANTTTATAFWRELQLQKEWNFSTDEELMFVVGMMGHPKLTMMDRRQMHVVIP